MYSRALLRNQGIPFCWFCVSPVSPVWNRNLSSVENVNAFLRFYSSPVSTVHKALAVARAFSKGSGDHMKRSKSPKLPNYMRKINHLWNTGALPRGVGLHMVDVFHDSWCRIYQGKRCNCDPDIALKATMPGTMN